MSNQYGVTLSKELRKLCANVCNNDMHETKQTSRVGSLLQHSTTTNWWQKTYENINETSKRPRSSSVSCRWDSFCLLPRLHTLLKSIACHSPDTLYAGSWLDDCNWSLTCQQVLPYAHHVTNRRYRLLAESLELIWTMPNPACPPLLVVNSYRDRDSHAGFYSQITLAHHAHLYLQAQRIVRHPWQMLQLGGEIKIAAWGNNALASSAGVWLKLGISRDAVFKSPWNYWNLQYLPMAYVMAVHSISWQELEPEIQGNCQRQDILLHNAPYLCDPVRRGTMRRSEQFGCWYVLIKYDHDKVKVSEAASIAGQPGSQRYQSQEGSVVSDTILRKESTKHGYVLQHIETWREPGPT